MTSHHAVSPPARATYHQSFSFTASMWAATAVTAVIG